MSKTTSKLHRCIKIHRVVRLHAHDDNSAPSRIYQGATYLTMQAKMTKQSKANGNVYVYIFVHEQMSTTASKKKGEGVNKKAHVKLEGCTAPTPSAPITTTTRRLYRVTLDGLLPLLGLNRVLDNGFLILGSDFRVHATGSELI